MTSSPLPRARAVPAPDRDGPDFWTRREPDGSYVLGFTDDAQRRLGTVVYLRGPDVGRTYRGGESAFTLESEKCVRQLSIPAGGTVVEVNRDLEGDPSTINRDPYGRGWVCRVRPLRPGALESATQFPPRTAR